MTTIIEMFSPDFLLKDALYGSFVICLTCPLAGIYLILRRMVLFGLALPQISSAGVAFAYLLHTVGIHFFPHEDQERVMAMTGAMIFTAMAIIILVLLVQKGRALNDAQVGAAYAVAAAASILFVAANPFGEKEILSLLKGEVLGILPNELLRIFGITSLVALCLVVFQRTFTLVSFDPDMATTIGKPVAAWDLFLFGLIGVLVAHSVMVVGPLMVFGFLIFPAMAAHRIAMHFSWGMSKVALAAAAFGGTASLIGFSLSLRFDLPLGPTNVFVAFAFLLASVAGVACVQALARVPK